MRGAGVKGGKEGQWDDECLVKGDFWRFPKTRLLLCMLSLQHVLSQPLARIANILNMEGHSQSEFVWPASFNEQRGARPKNNEEAIRELLAPLDDPKRRRKATSPPTTDDTMQSTDVLTDCGIQFSDTLADSDHTKLRQDRVQSSRRYWERGTLHQGERFRPLEEGTPETFIDPSQDASLQELHESIASHSGDYALETEGESSSNAPLAPTLANEPIFGNPYDLQREIDTFDDTEEDEEGIENEGELLDGEHLPGLGLVLRNGFDSNLPCSVRG